MTKSAYGRAPIVIDCYSKEKLLCCAEQLTEFRYIHFPQMFR